MARILPWRRSQLQQEHFRSLRKGVPQNFMQFLSRIAESIPRQEQELIGIVREIVARFSNMDADLIHAGDNTRELSSVMAPTSLLSWIATLGDSGPDEESFFFALREQGKNRLGKDCFVDLPLRRTAIERWHQGVPFGDWAAWLAHEIANTQRSIPRE